MSILLKIIIIFLLVVISAFFSVSEIALASARKLKLQGLIEEGNERAQKILKIQENSGDFFAIVQIGINIVSILGGSLGSSIVKDIIIKFKLSHYNENVLSVISFLLITFLFVQFADLIPKRVAMVYPENIALKTVNLMSILIFVFKPVIKIINFIADFILGIFRIDSARNETVTYDDIVAVVDAGAVSGILQEKEHSLIENIFELDSRWVSSIMTTRDEISYLTLDDSEETLREKIMDYPHNKFLITSSDIDSILGYVTSKDLLPSIMLNEKPISELIKNYRKNLLILPNTLTLSETLDRFNEAKDDFAIILNEYGLVVGLVTMKDVVNTLMGDIVFQNSEDQQIISRDENSWLIDGVTSVEDVKKVLDRIERFPEEDTYESLAGFLIYMLKTIPKRGAKLDFMGYRFEIVDVDNYKIDQILVIDLQQERM
ncbi:hemolysin family protein [Fusobacterium sp.]|uniref:hemolysin family protein n=1 Tax=Fusobacterium TaxID=848 RepID=UPI0025B88461|nr:hemolysin family protein [Fusobacterium sp.]MCI5724249.1 hemolysin family protein [Fusobacterium sp.]MCI7223453.1 hemolysin family protein [Fusobacterium sp.]MDD7392700.1 hemolysin family protein [Fusobacteriaceae bacterium]MDY5794223.1 hemolysin family protein [Fusobacterium gastrosuis]